MRISLIFLVLILLTAGCSSYNSSSNGGGGDQTTNQIFDAGLPDGVISFEVSLLNTADYKYIVSLGNLNPPDHTLPTDHVYFTHDDATETIPVYAPTSGKILDIYPFTYDSGSDHRLIIGTHKNYSYYLIHLVASSSLSEGDTVTAGQQLGVASSHAAAVDLGVLNQNSPQPFINPDHYVNTNIYSDAPLKYYVEPVKSQLYAAVQRLGGDKDGRFCYDQAGKLIGGWFLAGTASSEITAGTAVGTKEIAFVYDNYDPDQIMISVGGTVISKEVYYVQNGATDPAEVTPSNGRISYKLYLGSSEADRAGLMIAEMLSANQVKVEGFNDTVSETADFTAAAKTYER